MTEPVRTAIVCAAAVAWGCSSERTIAPHPLADVCSQADAGAEVDINGQYRYDSNVFGLRGTLTFEQVGTMARVVEVTYANSPDRPLIGEGMLSGNQLDIQLVPENGDTDYSTDVSFVFGVGGDTFCVVSFADTNGDVGGNGHHYFGERL